MLILRVIATGLSYSQLTIPNAQRVPMLIDFAYLCLLILAVFKGFQKGFIVAVFSFFAVVTGLAAALQLSAAAAGWLGTNINVNARFLPVLAFILVMVVVAWAVQTVGLMIQKALQMVMLGFFNRAAGIILYVILYTILLSVILFYAQKLNLIGQATIDASYCYQFVQPWAPAAIHVFATLLPSFKNLFQHLEHFFDKMAKKAA